MESKPTDTPTNAQPQPKIIKTSENKPYSMTEKIIIFSSLILLIISFPISLWCSFRVLHEFQRAVIFRLGRLKKKIPSGPGLIFLVPCVDSIKTLDLRVKSFDVPPQEAITKDAVTIVVDAIVYYRITSPVDCIVQVQDYDEATQYLAQTKLRNVVGTKKLWEVLTAKGEISKEVAYSLEEYTDLWGIKVDRVEIREIIMPDHMQRAMALETESFREAKAKINSANGELNSVQSLKEAADVFSQSKVALQLRYLQTLKSIAPITDFSYILPFPIKTLHKVLGYEIKESSIQPGSSNNNALAVNLDPELQKRFIDNINLPLGPDTEVPKTNELHQQDAEDVAKKIEHEIYHKDSFHPDCKYCIMEKQKENKE